MADITAADWSLRLDASPGDGSGLGQVVQGIDDVAQCIAIILGTPKGSDILRPTFGSNLWQYIDRPINQSIPAIVRDATDAITLWEPRVELISISAAPMFDGSVESGATLRLTITWRLKLGSAVQSTNVTIGRPKL